MNKRGFTLIELLATIVILAIIIGIAVPSISSVSKAIKERQRENLIERIEIAASKYAFDTKETIIFVDKLVTEGYLESDDEEGNIADPLTTERMNCYIVEMRKKSDYYVATFKEDKNYDTGESCDINKLTEDNASINISVAVDGNTITETNSWIKGNIITLNATSDDINIDCASNKCVWTSNKGTNEVGKTELTINNNTLLESKYTFQLTSYSTSTQYQKSINLKVDNEAPIIYENEINVTNKFIYTDTKKVTISASDGKGSGIQGYYLAKDTGQTCFSTENTFQDNNTFTIDSNGTYLICVKDNVGNVSSYSGLTINYIK